MKLIKLKINNIASIEEAEILFNEGVLATADRFLICGDMGTGKSTLLDSICLALYNNTPRLSQASNDKQDYGSDNISAQDPRNLLRHGCSSGMVELDFEGSEGKLYKAVWECNRSRNHILQPVSHTLYCGNEVIKLKKDIENRIKEVAVGLDFSQFCRTTLLAQGQFTQFLKSKENEKSAILEKLTQTDIYSAVGKEIDNIRREKEQECSALEAEIKGAQLFSQEEIDQHHADISTCNEQIALLKTQKATLDQQSQWLTKVNESKAQKEEAEKRLHELNIIIENTEYQQEEILIRDWNNSNEGRQLLEEHTEIEQKLQQLKTEQTQRGKIAFETAQKGLNFFKYKYEEQKASLSNLQKMLSEESVHSSMYNQYQAIILRLENAKKGREKTALLERERESLQEQLPALMENAKQIEDSTTKLSVQIGKYKEEEKHLQDELNDLHPQQLEEQRDTTDQQLQQLQEARQCCQNLNIVLQQIAETSANITKRQEQQQIENQKIIKNQALAKERRQNLEFAKEALEKTKLAVGDEAERLRAQLHTGDTCPICGNIIQQLQETESLQKILKPQQENVKNAELQLSEVEGLIKASETIIQNHQSEIQLFTKKLNNYTSLRDKSEKMTLEVCQQIGLTLTTPDDLLNAISQREQTLKTERDTISQQLKRVTEKREQLIRHQKTQQELSDKEKQSAIQLEKTLQQVTSCKESIGEHQQRIAEELEHAGTEFNIAKKQISWTAWEKTWEEEPERFIRRLHEAAQRYLTGEQEATRQSHATEMNQRLLQEMESLRNEILQQWPEWHSDNEERMPISDIMETWKALSQNADRLHTLIMDLEKRKGKNKGKIESFLERHPEITWDRLTLLSRLTSSQIPTERHQKMEKERQAAEGAFQQADKNLAERLQSPHPDIAEGETLETLLARTQAVEEKTHQLMTLRGKAQGLLDQNKMNEHAIAGKKQRFEALHHTAEQWKQLSGLFGTKDGTNFRNVAQSYLLQNLVRNANEYLKELTQRYRLDCIPGTLTLSLRDLYQGEVESPVDTLSGGESFLVSLSLALALSSINRKGFSIDTLFIDEGFGNLSSNELETVLNMLGRLKKMNGKRVGIISHVETVKEHIPVHVEVKRIDPTRSKIEVVDISRRERK